MSETLLPALGGVGVGGLLVAFVKWSAQRNLQGLDAALAELKANTKEALAELRSIRDQATRHDERIQSLATETRRAMDTAIKAHSRIDEIERRKP